MADNNSRLLKGKSTAKPASELDNVGNGFMFGSERKDRREEAMEIFHTRV